MVTCHGEALGRRARGFVGSGGHRFPSAGRCGTRFERPLCWRSRTARDSGTLPLRRCAGRGPGKPSLAGTRKERVRTNSLPAAPFWAAVHGSPGAAVQWRRQQGSESSPGTGPDQAAAWREAAANTLSVCCGACTSCSLPVSTASNRMYRLRADSLVLLVPAPSGGQLLGGRLPGNEPRYGRTGAADRWDSRTPSAEGAERAPRHAHKWARFAQDSWADYLAACQALEHCLFTSPADRRAGSRVPAAAGRRKEGRSALARLRPPLRLRPRPPHAVGGRIWNRPNSSAW